MHKLTSWPTSSPFFFFWRRTVTNGTASFGIPTPITLGMTLAATLAFTLPSLRLFDLHERVSEAQYLSSS